MVNIDGIETAKNSIEFATSPKFLDIASLWPMQIKILASLFEDVCMSRTCTDLEFWNGILVDTPVERIRERVTFFDRGKCPHCGKTRLDFPRWYNFKNELVFVAGMRSGKTALISEVMAPYILHRALTREDNFGLMEGSTMVGTFFAPSIYEAINCDWHMFSYRVKKSPWFREFHEALRLIESQQEGASYLKETSTSLSYPQHNITLYCGNYRSLARIRGRTALFAVVSGFDLNPKLDPSLSLSEGSLRSIRMTLRTIRADQERKVRGGDFNAQQGMLLYQSAGFSGMAKKLYDQATTKTSENRSVGFRLATWEINPQVSEEDMLDECKKFREGRSTFERDFAVSSIA